MKTFLALFVAICGLNLSLALYIPTTFWPSDNDYDLFELTKKYESNEDQNIFSTLFDENDDETSNKNNHEYNLNVSAELLTNTNEDLIKEIDLKKENNEVNNEARDSENTENNDHEKDNDQNDSTNANIDENSNEVAVDDNKSVSVGDSTLSYDTKKEEEMAKMLQEIDELYTLWKRVYDRNGVIEDMLEERVEIFKSFVLKKDLSARDVDASNKNENEKNKNDNVEETDESNTNDDARSDNDYMTFTINNDIEATDNDPSMEFDFVAINDDKIENDSSATADPSQFYYHTILEQ